MLPNGLLVYLHDNSLLAQPFDATRPETTGGAVPAIEQVRFSGVSGTGQFDVASNGTIVYVAGAVQAAFRMVWVDRSGKEEFVDLSNSARTELEILQRPLRLPVERLRCPTRQPPGSRASCAAQ